MCGTNAPALRATRHGNRAEEDSARREKARPLTIQFYVDGSRRVNKNTDSETRYGFSTYYHSGLSADGTARTFVDCNPMAVHA